MLDLSLEGAHCKDPIINALEVGGVVLNVPAGVVDQLFEPLQVCMLHHEILLEHSVGKHADLHQVHHAVDPRHRSVEPRVLFERQQLLRGIG